MHVPTFKSLSTNRKPSPADTRCQAGCGRQSCSGESQLGISQLGTSQLGLSALGTLLVILIIGVVGYLGSQVFPMFYTYWDLQAQFDSMAEKAGEKSDKEIREFLTSQIRMARIGDDRTDLTMLRRNRTMTIDMEYTQTLSFTLSEEYSWDLHEFDFVLHSEADF